MGGTLDQNTLNALQFAQNACFAGVNVSLFNVRGLFRNFIKYSKGCGGLLNGTMPEAIKAWAQVELFIHRHARRSSRYPPPSPPVPFILNASSASSLQKLEPYKSW